MTQEQQDRYEIGRSREKSGFDKLHPPFDSRRIRPGMYSDALLLYGKALSLPDDPGPLLPVGKLADALHLFFSTEAQVGPPAPSLCTFWTLHTWFADALPLSPPLVVTGPRRQAESLFSALHAVSRHGLMLCSGTSAKDLRALPLEQLFPTLLMPEPQLGRGMESLLSMSTRPGRLLASFLPASKLADSRRVQDRFCPKAIYLGEDATCTLGVPDEIRLHLTPVAFTAEGPVLSGRELHNRLFAYRIKHWITVDQSSYTADELSKHTREAAEVLARAVVDAIELQKKVPKLLERQDEAVRAERSESREGLILEALVMLVHETTNARLLAGTISERVNELLKKRQEMLTVSAEDIGHSLKRLGLQTVRLGSAGRGLTLEKRTRGIIHRLARSFEVLAPGAVKDCSFCQEAA